MKHIDFDNTQIAFEYRTIKELKRAKFLFSSLRFSKIVAVGSSLILILNKIRIAPLWILEPFMFSQFCGGTTIEEAKKTAIHLSKYGVKSIPDFSVEGKTDEHGIDIVVEEIIRTMALVSSDSNFAYSVFKPTALAPSNILEKMSKKQSLTEDETRIASLFHRRFERLCEMADHYNIRLLIDAEEYCFQDIIDQKTELMMKKFNIGKTVIFNTIQMYRQDRIGYLQNLITKARNEQFNLGFKVVRGAYLEKENKLAIKNNYPSPIYPNKNGTDDAYNKAIEIIIDNIDICELYMGTHNRESVEHLIELMNKKNIHSNDPRIVIGQLYGMSDNLSFNLTKNNYNVAKYVPYGPLRETIPYLIRRAQENTSVAGQTGRELIMINQEIERRNSESNNKNSQ